VGVGFWRSRFGRQLHIGTRTRNTPLPDQFQGAATEGLLKLLDGTRTLSTIAAATGLTRQVLEEFVAMLIKLNLIDTYRPKKLATSAAIVDSIGSQAIREIQLQIECDAVTFREKVEDRACGGRPEIANRGEFEILIFGNSRIAVTILGALRAAGFTRSDLIDRAPQGHPSRVIQPSDLMGGIFRKSEILQKKESVLNTLNQPQQRPLEPFQTPDLIISVGSCNFEAQQRWISEGTAHLAISYETSGEVRLGPIVIPGTSPCLTCIEMSEIDAGLEARLRPIAPEVEVGVGLALFTAGVALLEISTFATTGASQLIARTLDISSFRFFDPEIRQWNFHPLCGCRS